MSLLLAGVERHRRVASVFAVVALFSLLYGETDAAVSNPVDEVMYEAAFTAPKLPQDVVSGSDADGLNALSNMLATQAAEAEQFLATHAPSLDSASQSARPSQVVEIEQPEPALYYNDGMGDAATNPGAHQLQRTEQTMPGSGVVDTAGAAVASGVEPDGSHRLSDPLSGWSPQSHSPTEEADPTAAKWRGTMGGSDPLSPVPPAATPASPAPAPAPASGTESAPAPAPAEDTEAEPADNTDAKMLRKWDAATRSAGFTPLTAREQTMPPAVRTAKKVTAVVAKQAEPLPPQVPKAQQGNRAAQQHMLKVVQHEMERSNPTAEHEENGGYFDESESYAGEQHAVKKLGVADPLGAASPKGASAQEAKIATAKKEVATAKKEKKEDTAAEVKKAQEVKKAKAAKQKKLDKAKAVAKAVSKAAAKEEAAANSGLDKLCTTVHECELQAQVHVRKAGEAVAAAAAAKTEDKRADEDRWQRVVRSEKRLAVEATVRARQLATKKGMAKVSQQTHKVLAVAQKKEAAQKAAESKVRKFDVTVTKEATQKSEKHLVKLREEATDADTEATRAAAAAEAQQKAAQRAEALAERQKTKPNLQDALQERQQANALFGEAHEAKQKAVAKHTEAGTLATKLEADKLTARRDAECARGAAMSSELCKLGYQSAAATCHATAVQGHPDEALVAACLARAEKQRLTCRALLLRKQNECRELAAKQISGGDIAGFELRLSAAMSVDSYTPAADRDLREAVARRVGVALTNVVTVAVKAGDQLEVTLAVVGPEAPLKAKVGALLGALGSGDAVGGVTATSAAARYSPKLQLPGRKPAAWVSERAEKAWEKSQAEARKLVGMPSDVDAREVNSKAHLHLLHSKKNLAQAKTKEAKLKKESTEMSTKVARKAALKKQQREVDDAMDGMPSGGAATAVAKGGALPSPGQSDMQEAGDGGKPRVSPSVDGEGDFTVIRSRWWKHRGAWLQSKYPALHSTLDKAKKAGNEDGDQVWMQFLLNWFYCKEREKSGYRFSWNADGSYSAQRHLVIACRRYLATEEDRGTHWESGTTSPTGECRGQQARNVYSVSIRSVNNLCYPGVAEAAAKANVPAGGGVYARFDTRAKACVQTAPVSVRLHRFRLVKPKRTEQSGMLTGTNGAPAMFLLRAYRAVKPTQYARKMDTFADVENDGLVGVHRIKWSVNEVVEYCEKEGDDTAAVPYDEESSWPRKRHPTGDMRWDPIVVSDRQEPNSDRMLTILQLHTANKKLGITCRTPQQAGVVDGHFLTPTDTKCDIKIQHWNYRLSCPPGKIRGLAVQTSVMSRYDDHEQSHESGATKVNLNSNKMTLRFQKRASLRQLMPNGKWRNRGQVFVRSKVSAPHWVPDTNFQSHRHYSFSFAIHKGQDLSQIQNSELVWDPQLTSNFKPEEVTSKLQVQEVDMPDQDLTPRGLVGSLLGLGSQEAAMNASAKGCASSILAMAIPLLMMTHMLYYH